MWARYLWAVAMVAAAGGAAVVIDAAYGPPDVALLFLVPIVLSAVWHGRGPSIVAATLSVAAFDFLLVPPRFTFAVAESRYLLTFVMMFGVGLVISELTARLRATAIARAEAAAEAEVADRRARAEEIRSTLLSAVSHDLRTPLAVISGAASTLRDEQLDEGQRHELLAAVCDEAERLERLVDNLLDMTRLQAGVVVVRAEWVPLEEIVGSALGRLERRLGDRPVEVELAAEPRLLFVDPVLVEQVLVNLVENAIKYTPSDAAIELRSFARGDHVVIEVLDRGPGLPAELVARAFETFVRGETRDRDGFGLGLAICRAIVGIHGGAIAARAREGGGACIEVTLPRAAGEPSGHEEPVAARESA